MTAAVATGALALAAVAAEVAVCGIHNKTNTSDQEVCYIAFDFDMCTYQRRSSHARNNSSFRYTKYWHINSRSWCTRRGRCSILYENNIAYIQEMGELPTMKVLCITLHCNITSATAIVVDANADAAALESTRAIVSATCDINYL